MTNKAGLSIFTGTQPYPFFYIFSTAFTLKKQNRVVATEATWPRSVQLQKRFANPYSITIRLKIFSLFMLNANFLSIYEQYTNIQRLLLSHPDFRGNCLLSHYGALHCSKPDFMIRLNYPRKSSAGTITQDSVQHTSKKYE